ncbi:hypothetical protein [Sporosarcina obsidiansis]|uniref:hypothetical protein n=1 Tax=Sporosarcina obsidiansis TaxID=2660748 RepID=UPI00129B007B|nr:hypothetical protein [Sporosarcina obsidiansis]
MKIIIDLQTFSGVKQSLKNLLDDNFERFEKRLIEFLKDESFNEKIDTEFLKENKLFDLSNINYENIYFKGFHYTTRGSSKSCYEDIKPLPRMLTEETTLKQFFTKYGIEFDLENNTLIHNDVRHEIISNDKMSSIETKVNTDPEVWAFLRTKDITYYFRDNYGIPEFVGDIYRYLDYNSEFLEEWKRLYGVPWVIEFVYPLSRMDVYANFHEMGKNSFLKEQNGLDDESENYYIEEFKRYQIKGTVDLVLKTYLGMLKRYLIPEIFDCKEGIEYLIDIDFHNENKDELFNQLNEYSVYTKNIQVFDDEHLEIIMAVNKGEVVPSELIVKNWDIDEFNLFTYKENRFV